jgi:hypothetical protein
MGVEEGLRIAYTNQKLKLEKQLPEMHLEMINEKGKN